MPEPLLFPHFKYRDALAAIEFLVDAFGFERREVHADGDVVHHAVLGVGASGVMLGSGDPALPPVDERGVPTVGVYVAVDDPDALHERAVAAGARVTRPPQDTDYGSREFSAADPEGYVWSFGSYRP